MNKVKTIVIAAALFFSTVTFAEILSIKLPLEASMVFSSSEYGEAMEQARNLSTSLGCDEISYTKIFVEEAADLKSVQVKMVLRAYFRPDAGPTKVVSIGEVLAKLVYQSPKGPRIESLIFVPAK